MRGFAIALLLGLSPSPSFGAESSTPPPLPIERPSKDKDKAPSVTPLALALSLAFEPKTWSAVGVSSGPPAVELTRLIAHGHYRLELIQLILMAERISGRLSDMVEQRVKVKKSLREIAVGLGIDYEALYGEALAKAREVERRTADVSRVSVRTKEKP